MKRETQRHVDAFEAWYASDRNWKLVTERFHVSLTAARQWADAFDWRSRADARDAEAARKAEREAITRRARVLEEQRRAGELLRRRGVQYYTQHEIGDGREAIQAIAKGVELERAAEDMAAARVEVTGKDGSAISIETVDAARAELAQALARLTERLAAGSITGDALPAGDGAAGE